MASKVASHFPMMMKNNSKHLSLCFYMHANFRALWLFANWPRNDVWKQNYVALLPSGLVSLYLSEYHICHQSCCQTVSGQPPSMQTPVNRPYVQHVPCLRMMEMRQIRWCLCIKEAVCEWQGYFCTRHINISWWCLSSHGFTVENLRKCQRINCII